MVSKIEDLPLSSNTPEVLRGLIRTGIIATKGIGTRPVYYLIQNKRFDLLQVLLVQDCDC